MSDHTAAILDRYARAGAVELAAGRAWYPNAARHARRIARVHGLTFRCAAGILAALSPRLRWAENIEAAYTLAHTGTAPALSRSVAKARRIRDGARPLDVLGGPKTRAFYRNITGDTRAVTVDVWAARAAGAPYPSTPARYAELSYAYRCAAAEAGETPRDLQAIVWCVERGNHE